MTTRGACPHKGKLNACALGVLLSLTLGAGCLYDENDVYDEKDAYDVHNGDEFEIGEQRQAVSGPNCAGADQFYLSSTGSCYQFRNTTFFQWQHSQWDCQSLGTGWDLAVLATQQEIDDVTGPLDTIMSNHGIPHNQPQRHVWLGGSDPSGGGQNFVWFNGEPWTYANQAPPWYYSFPQAAAGNCVRMDMYNPWVDGQFHNASCASTDTRTLCERPDSPTVCDPACGAGHACAEGVCVLDEDLRVTLTWNLHTDIDLHVTTPNSPTASNEIWFGNQGSEQSRIDGGFIDRDWISTSDGPQPIESVSFNSTYKAGTYQIRVNNYSGALDTPVVLEVFKQGVLIHSSSFTVTASGATRDKTENITVSNP